MLGYPWGVILAVKEEQVRDVMERAALLRLVSGERCRPVKRLMGRLGLELIRAGQALRLRYGENGVAPGPDFLTAQIDLSTHWR